MKAKEFGLVIGAIWLLAAPLSAETLLIDFGLSTMTVTSATSTNNPGGIAPTSNADWNIVAAPNTNTSFLYADGTAASGVTLSEGGLAGASSTTEIDWATHPTAATLSGSISANNFAAGEPVYGGIYDSGESSVGVQISGLAAGTYNLFIVGDTTSSTSPGSETFYAGDVGSSLLTSTAYNYTSLSSTGTESNTSISNSTWVLGTNYQELTVTINSSTDVLALVAAGGGTTALNMLEIVAVPEPRTWAELIFGGVTLFFIIRRRRTWAV